MNMIKDYLQDLVDHINALGNVQYVKLVGDKKETKFFAIAEDNSVVINGKFRKPASEFMGTFGIPNLAKLNVILGIPEYDEDSVINVETQKKGEDTIPVCLHFANKGGDFKNDYRFMSTEVINEKLKSVKFKGVEWDVDVAPSIASINKFKFQSQANNDEPLFTAKTENKNLVFHFGDVSSYAGNFVFEPKVSGTLNKGFAWPVAPVICILNLVGDKVMQFSNQGALLITVDSGTALYEYILPAQSK